MPINLSSISAASLDGAGPEIIKANNDTATTTLYPVMISAADVNANAKVTTSKINYNASTGKLDVTGIIKTTTYQETKATVSASDIDLSTGNYFSKTISGTTTFTVSNVPSTGTVGSFILDLTNGGSATVNWWANTKWSNGSQPTLTVAGRDVLGFFTYDGGSTWTGLLIGKDVK
jgi:hypothetical protein